MWIKNIADDLDQITKAGQEIDSYSPYMMELNLSRFKADHDFEIGLVGQRKTDDNCKSVAKLYTLQRKK
jgi:hypothetical protein